MVDSKQQWKAWLYLSPAIVLLLVFTVWTFAALQDTETFFTVENDTVTFDAFMYKYTVDADDNVTTGTIQEHAFDIFTINKATRTVNITRTGLGEDRSFTY